MGAPVVSLAFVLDTKLELEELFLKAVGTPSLGGIGTLAHMSGGLVSLGVEVRRPVCLEAPLVS